MHAAWRLWTKEFQESESYSHYRESAQEHRAHNAGSDKQQQSTWNNTWQHFGNWQDTFFRKSAGSNRSSSSQQQHRQDAGRKVFQVQQQHCMKILGLSSASVLNANAIRTAFLECAKKWHPDRHSDDAKSDAESKFKEAQTAYQHLLTCL